MYSPVTAAVLIVGLMSVWLVVLGFMSLGFGVMVVGA